MVGRNTPKNYFPKVYDYCKNKNSFVSECNTTGRWEFDFTRTFGPEEMQEWGELLDKLKDVTLGWRKIVIWKLERSGHFTTTSLYRWMSFKGMKNKRAEKIWRSKLPMKLKVFLWLTIQDRLPTKTKMEGGTRLRDMWGAGNPQLYMFSCIVARFTWTCLKEAFGWDRIPAN